MAKPTARNLNQLIKVIFFTSGFSFVFTAAFSQFKKTGYTYPGPGNTKSLFTDSLLAQLKNSAASFKQVFLSSFKDSKSQLFARLTGNSQKELAGITGNLFKNPLVFHTAAISSEGLLDTSYLGGKQYYHTNFNFSSDWSVAGIPLDIDSRQQSWSDFKGNDLLQFSFHFDRENYLSQLKKGLAGKINPSSLLDQVKNPLEDIITKAKQNLVTELEAISDRYKGLLKNEVQQIKMMQDLVTTDIKSIKAKFLDPSFVKDISRKQELLTALQQQINNGERTDNAELNSLRDEVLKMKALQELVNRIEHHKTKWEQSGLLAKIKEFGLLKQASITKLLNDPSVITRLARQKLSLSGLQRFFLNINRLDIGQNALSSGPLSFQHFLSKGITTELLTNTRSVVLIAGKQTDFNSILDFPFSNSPFSNNGIVKSIGIGSGNGSRSTTNLSVSSFSQSMAGLTDAFNPAMLRQVLVTTISNRLSIGEKGMMSVELSRSATQYSQGRNSSDSSTGEKNNLSRIFSTGNFMGNTAVSLKYADEFTDQGLSYHISFNKTANGYTNPGNSYLSAGSTELGTGIRKVLLKNKLFLSFRGNTRVYRYNDKEDARWVNTHMLLDVKWKMKKGQYIAFRYQPMKMLRKENSSKRPVSSLERIAVDASLYRKFGRLAYRNFFSLSGQWNSYSPDPAATMKNSSVTISSFQHLLLGKKMVYINMNYTHADNSAPQLFLNSSFYAETGYSYQLLKNITASSGLIYNNSAGWYRQAGIRQTISGQLGEKVSINIYVDMKKNLRVFHPLWDDPVRADMSLRYIINNKN